MRSVRPPARLVAMALVLLAVLSACGGGAGEDATCGPVVDEDLDPEWALHLLPSAPEPEYLTEPPTSGPHLTTEPATGVQDTPLDRPEQVSVLEVGSVLVQYRPTAVDDADRGRLERLAADDVVVAPNPDLDDPVVATAWLRKQACDGVAIEAVTAFTQEERGRGPGA